MGNDKEYHFNVTGMTCGGCENTIVRALLDKFGSKIKEIKVSCKDNTVVITSKGCWSCSGTCSCCKCVQTKGRCDCSPCRCCKCGTTQMIEVISEALFVAGTVSTLVGIIVCIAVYATTDASPSVDFKLKAVKAGEVPVNVHYGTFGYDLRIDATTSTADCIAQLNATTVTDPNGNSVQCDSHCIRPVREKPDWQVENDVPLRDMCRFMPTNWGTSTPTLEGAYTITSNANIWVVDAAEEYGKVVEGFLAAGAILVIGVIILAIGPILCCIGCCCLCMGEKR